MTRHAVPLSCWELQSLLAQSPVLRGAKLLGRGMFSTVFDTGNPETVLKVCCDPAHIALCSHPQYGKGRHFLQVIENFGVVGEANGFQMHLMEVERLVPLRNSRDRYNLFMAYSLHRQWTRGSLSGTEYLMKRIADKTLPITIRGALAQLHGLITEAEGDDIRLDIRPANFMVRESDQSLVLNDPICCITAVSRVWEMYA